MSTTTITKKEDIGFFERIQKRLKKMSRPRKSKACKEKIDTLSRMEALVKGLMKHDDVPPSSHEISASILTACNVIKHRMKNGGVGLVADSYYELLRAEIVPRFEDFVLRFKIETAEDDSIAEALKKSINRYSSALFEHDVSEVVREEDVEKVTAQQKLLWTKDEEAIKLANVMSKYQSKKGVDDFYLNIRTHIHNLIDSFNDCEDVSKEKAWETFRRVCQNLTVRVETEIAVSNEDALDEFTVQARKIEALLRTGR